MTKVCHQIESNYAKISVFYYFAASAFKKGLLLAPMHKKQLQFGLPYPMSQHSSHGCLQGYMIAELIRKVAVQYSVKTV